MKLHVKSAGTWFRQENIAVLHDNRRIVAGASIPYIQWMSKCVPPHQLSPEQREFVRWYETATEHAA